jgi:hypothetical protein
MRFRFFPRREAILIGARNFLYFIHPFDVEEYLPAAIKPNVPISVRTISLMQLNDNSKFSHIPSMKPSKNSSYGRAVMADFYLGDIMLSALRITKELKLHAIALLFHIFILILQLL